MTNTAKAGLTLVVLIILIAVGIVWYMGSPTAPAAPAAISFDTASTGESTTAALRTDASDQSIRGNVASIDSDMNSLNADVASMDALEVQNAVATSTGSSALVQRLNMLRTLTETEKSVLAANLKIDTNARLMAPEISILAAGDRIYGIVDEFQPLYSKLQIRTSEASTTASSTISGGPDWTATLSEIDAKLTDARAQAGKAHDEVIALKPDQGDRAVQQTNLAILKDGRKKITTASQDLLTARQDATKIIQGLSGSPASGK